MSKTPPKQKKNPATPEPPGSGPIRVSDPRAVLALQHADLCAQVADLEGNLQPHIDKLNRLRLARDEALAAWRNSIHAGSNSKSPDKESRKGKDKEQAQKEPSH